MEEKKKSSGQNKGNNLRFEGRKLAVVAIGRTWGKKSAGSLSDSESRTPRQASREGTVAGILYRWPKAIPPAFVRGNVDWPGISSAVVNVATAAIFT